MYQKEMGLHPQKPSTRMFIATLCIIAPKMGKTQMFSNKQIVVNSWFIQLENYSLILQKNYWYMTQKLISKWRH